MIFAVISDTHFGDKDSGLVIKNKLTGKYETSEVYEAFKRKIGIGHDYLILIGDVFDFAIEEYSDAYEIGKVFLNKVVDDGIVSKGFIYLPGNHDFDLWHLTEYEANVINRLKNGKKTREFRHSVPGIIDVRGKNAVFKLYGVTPYKDKENNSRYGGLYLDNLIEKNKELSKTEQITFNIAYPNLYLFTKEETILFNHGHYLGQYWSLMSQYGKDLTKEEKGCNPELKLQNNTIYLDVNNMKDMVSLNFPLNQLSSSGVGQAGKFGKIVSKVEHNLKQNKKGRVVDYINNLFKILNDNLMKNWPKFIKRILLGLIKNKLRDELLSAIAEYNEPRNNLNFLSENQERLTEFYNVTVKELKELKVSTHKDKEKFLKNKLEEYLFEPTKIIYGHTHVPSPWDKSSSKTNSEDIKINGKEILTYNTGGWLSEAKDSEGKNTWQGAEIFFINNKGEMSSTRVDNSDRISNKKGLL